MSTKSTEQMNQTASGVDHSTCEARMEKVYNKISAMNKSLFTIIGGVIVIGFVIPILIAIVATFANYRFSVIEKQMEKLIEKVGNKYDGADKNKAIGNASTERPVDRLSYMDNLDTFEDKRGLDPFLRGKEEAREHSEGKNGSPRIPR